MCISENQVFVRQLAYQSCWEFTVAEGQELRSEQDNSRPRRPCPNFSLGCCRRTGTVWQPRTLKKGWWFGSKTLEEVYNQKVDSWPKRLRLGLREPLAPIKPLAARAPAAIKAVMQPPPDNKAAAPLDSLGDLLQCCRCFFCFQDPVEGLGEYYKSLMMKK